MKFLFRKNVIALIAAIMAVFYINNSYAGFFEDDDISKLKEITMDNFYDINKYGKTRVTINEALKRYQYFEDGEWLTDEDQYGNKIVAYRAKYDFNNLFKERNKGLRVNNQFKDDLLQYVSKNLNDKYEMLCVLIFNAIDYNFLGCQIIINNELYGGVVQRFEYFFNSIYENKPIPFSYVGIQLFNKDIENNIWKDERYFGSKFLLINDKEILDVPLRVTPQIKVKNMSEYNFSSFRDVSCSIEVDDIEYVDSERMIFLDTTVYVYFFNERTINTTLKQALDSGKCELVQKIKQKFYLSKRNFDRSFPWEITDAEFLPLENSGVLSCLQFFHGLRGTDISLFTLYPDNEKNKALREKLILK